MSIIHSERRPAARALAPDPLRHRAVGYRARTRARLAAGRLDRDLAEGIAPWRSPEHAARAGQLTTPRRRRSLAGCLERLLDDAGCPPRGFATAAIAPCRIQVQEARPELQGIADRLRGDEPIGAGGIVRLYALLRDSQSACYRFIDPTALARALQAIEAALDAHVS